MSGEDDSPAPTANRDIHVVRRVNCDSRLSHGAVHLFHYLFNRRNRNGQAWPTQSEIVRDIRCNGNRLKEWTASLTACQYLFIEKCGSHHNIRYTIGPGDDKSYDNLPSWSLKAEQSRITRTSETNSGGRTTRTGETTPLHNPPSNHPNGTVEPLEQVDRRTTRTSELSSSILSRSKEVGGKASPECAARGMGTDAGLLAKDKVRFEKMIEEEKLKVNPDRQLITSLRAEIDRISDEFKRRNAGTATAPSSTGPAKIPKAPPPKAQGNNRWHLSDEQLAENVKSLRKATQ